MQSSHAEAVDGVDTIGGRRGRHDEDPVDSTLSVLISLAGGSGLLSSVSPDLPYLLQYRIRCSTATPKPGTWAVARLKSSITLARGDATKIDLHADMTAQLTSKI